MCLCGNKPSVLFYSVSTDKCYSFLIRQKYYWSINSFLNGLELISLDIGDAF